MAPHEMHNLVPDDKEWNITRKNKRSHGVSDDNKKLELRLGPPGDHEEKRQLLYEDPFKSKNDQEKLWLTFCTEDGQRQLMQEQPIISKPSYCCQKRTTAGAPVVGWPPIRSCRKNLGSSSFSKAPLVTNNYDDEPQKKVMQDQGSKIDHHGKSEDHMFVKINMEGVPIGRKVDLKAYDSYEKLSYAIDELFRGLLAAQRDYTACENNEETGDGHSKTVTNGEFTLVYEDNEGDRMLVGDVPWKMFVSTAKRLRVLRSVEISTLKLSSSRIMMEKTALDPTMEIGG